MCVRTFKITSTMNQFPFSSHPSHQTKTTGAALTIRDLRRAPRFRGELPVRLERGTGITRDFNMYGVYFFTDEQHSVGESIEYSFFLSNHGSAPVQINCLGEVVRVEKVNGKQGVAVSLTSHTFEHIDLPAATLSTSWPQ